MTATAGRPSGAGPSQWDETVRRTVLDDGLRVVTEAVPGVRSAAVGVWVDVGSRDESPADAGVSHFLEHLLFKGTTRRDALTIAASVEQVGGDMNAWTGQEQTCYYARVLDADLALAVDVLGDMVTASLIRDADVDSERTVVLEEIAMREDEPADAVHEVFAATVFGDHPLGRPIAGTVASMTAMGRDQVHDYWRARYVPAATVVTVAGNVAHDDVVALVAAAMGGAGSGHGTPAEDRPDAGGPAPALGRVAVVGRDIEQANVVLGTAGLARRDPRRHVQSVLATLLGGGMSSRLFQEVRERRGLAYAVHCFTDAFADTGVLGVYAGCAPSRVDEVLAVCRDQLVDVAGGGLTDEEVARAKGQLRGALVLGLEDTGARMSRLGKGELVYGEMPSVAEVVRRVDAVTTEDVRALAAELFAPGFSLAVVAPPGLAEDRLAVHVAA